MLSGRDRAPDRTTTAPRDSEPGNSSDNDSDNGSKYSDAVSGSPDGAGPGRVTPTLPETAAILRRRCSTCSAWSSRRRSRLIADATADPPTPSDHHWIRIYVRYSE